MSVFDAVLISPDALFKLSSGRTSPVKFQVERMLHTPLDRKYVLDLLDEKLRNTYGALALDTFTFAGVETGGWLLATLLAERHGSYLLFVTKDGHIITGSPPHPSQVILVDDVFTTGESLAKAHQALNQAGYLDIRHLTLIRRTDV